MQYIFPNWLAEVESAYQLYCHISPLINEEWKQYDALQIIT